MAAEYQDLVTRLNLQDNMSSGLQRAMGNVNRFDQGMGRVNRGVGQLAQGLGTLATRAGVGMVAGFTASIAVAANFESQLQTINTIAQETPENLGEIGDSIRKLARESGADLSDLTSAYYDLLSAGVAVADAPGLLEQSELLATGTLGTTSQAVDVLTTALNSYNLPASEAARVTGELAVAVRDGKVKLDEIAPSYANVALTAANAGIETREIAAAFAQLTAKGAPAAEVTTQMNRAILSLIAPNNALLEAQEKLGVSFADIAREQGLHVALQRLREYAEDAGIPLLDLLGRSEALKFALATTGDNFDQFNTQLERVDDNAGVLADQVSERREGLAFQFKILKANILDAGITIGTAFLPKLTPLVAEIAQFISNNQGKIEQFAERIADALGKFIDRAKAGELQPFIDALSILAQVGGKVVELFLSLPPAAQSAIVTGLALNRLSGGALGAGAGNIISGALQIIFRRGDTPANPLFVANVGPGGVGGAPVAGGGAGLLTKALAALSVIAGGFLIGSTVGTALNEPTVAPARDFAASGIERVLQTGTVGQIRTALAAIESQLTSKDPLAQAALLFDVNGVRTTLEGQQAMLRERLSQVTMAGRDTSAKVRESGQVNAALLRQDVSQSQQIQANLAAASARRASEAGQQLSLQASSLGNLQQIAAKRTTFTVNAQVNISASGVLSQVSTYAKIREG